MCTWNNHMFPKIPGLVFIDSKDPYTMKLWKLRDKDTKKGSRVDEEVSRVILCVKTG